MDLGYLVEFAMGISPKGDTPSTNSLLPLGQTGQVAAAAGRLTQSYAADSTPHVMSGSTAMIACGVILIVSGIITFALGEYRNSDDWLPYNLTGTDARLASLAQIAVGGLLMYFSSSASPWVQWLFCLAMSPIGETCTLGG